MILPQIKGQSIACAIDWLESNGLPPLPVAPKQDAHKYPARDKQGNIIYESDGITPKPLFNGKNPSYLDAQGIPHLVKHSKFRRKKPTQAEKDTWWANPANGIGTIAGSAGINWVDIDCKGGTQTDRDNAVAQLLERVPRTYYEQTPSGGYHIAVKLNIPKNFTNFALSEDGPHIGEFLGKGRFVVLAPTNGYQSLNGRDIAAVNTPGSLGLWPTKGHSTTFTTGVKRVPLGQAVTGKTPPKTPSKSDTQPPSQDFKPPENPHHTVALVQLVAKKVKNIIDGALPTGIDASKELTRCIKELWGWQNFCRDRNIATDDSNLYIETAAANLGIDTARAERIKTGIHRNLARPAQQIYGVEKCQKRLDWLINPPQSPQISSNDIEIGDDETPGTFAWKRIFSHENWITCSGEAFLFVGTHYEKVDINKQRNRIADLLTRAISWKEKKGVGMVITRPWATNRAITDAVGYVLSRMPAVGPDELNLGGINCTNGLLKINWEGEQLNVQLVPHKPDQLFTVKPLVPYIPDADPTHCNRLLQAIEPKYQAIVLRTLAASLDLDTIRRFEGRAVRAACFVGSGSNGKDALKAAMAAILGRSGITSIPLNAFKQYDSAQQFGLAPLAGSRLNWPSENSFDSSLDKIESLKAAITGEELTHEKKHQQGVLFTPRAVMIFNGNPDTIKIIGAQEAIKSRYAIVPFEKTFKSDSKYDPNNPRHMRADSRFCYDKPWVHENVCPALLNLLLIELQNLASQGIDYTPVEDVMEQHKFDSFHLARFIADIGLEVTENPTDQILTADIWDQLKIWYQKEDMINIVNLPDGYEKIIWGEDPRPGDKLVKGSTQLTSALKRFLPDITNSRASSGPNKGKAILKGLRIKDETEPQPQATPEPQPIHTPEPPPPQPLPDTISTTPPTTPEVDQAIAKTLTACQSLDDYQALRTEFKPLYPTEIDWMRPWSWVPRPIQDRILSWCRLNYCQPMTT